MPGIFVSSASRAESNSVEMGLQPRSARFQPHERTQLLLARGVSQQLVDLLEQAGFSSLDAMRQLGVPAVMSELTLRFGPRTRGFSPRALARALETTVAVDARRTKRSADAAVDVPMPPDRPLMADIARAAGVALSTVSRALNDSDHVSEQTKQRIRELARVTRYERNSVAQSLRSRRVRTVTVLVPEANASDHRLGDAQDLALIGSLADALHEAGFELNLSRPRIDRMAQARETVTSGRAAGLVVLGAWPDVPPDLPVVSWGAPVADQACPAVHVDACEGSRLATRLLLDHGARHVVFVEDRHAPDLKAQRRGFLQAHRERGLAPASGSEIDLPGTAHTAEGMRACAAGKQLDGVVAASDWSALATVESLRLAGFRVPADVSVVGFGDLPIAVQGGLNLTTVQAPIQQAGQALVRLLLERMAGRRPDSVLLTPELVVRDSTRRS